LNSVALLVELSGWTIVALGIAQVALPFIARNRPLFQNHYGIGFMIAGLSLLHASVAVSGIAVSGTSAVLGIAIASGGMFLAFGQVAIGNRLRQAGGDRRSRLRRLHFALMLILAAAALTHLVLNGPATRAVLRL
jgi:hypothetical protein